MNHGELVRAVYERLNGSAFVPTTKTVPLKIVEAVIRVMVDVMIETLAEGEVVTVYRLGRFEVRVRKAHTRWSGLRGEYVEVRRSRVVWFTEGESVRREVNRGE